MLGDDLDGDQARSTIRSAWCARTLAQQNDLAPHPSDLRNLLPTAVEINAHDLIDDDHVGVSYIGRPGDTSTPATGTFSGGVYASERTADTAHPANGALVLPAVQPMQIRPSSRSSMARSISSPTAAAATPASCAA